MKTITYNNKKLRVTAALIASVFIIFHGRPINLVKAFTSAAFYVALIVSFAISLLLVYTVHRITVWLDGSYDWRSKPLERSVMQFAFGVLVPALADMLLISIYFEFLGENIVDNKISADRLSCYRSIHHYI